MIVTAPRCRRICMTMQMSRSARRPEIPRVAWSSRSPAADVARCDSGRMKHADAHLICRRHAQSVNVSTHQAGALPEVPLTDLGRHQAAVAARSVAGAGITAINASTAVRAEQTAGIIGSISTCPSS